MSFRGIITWNGVASDTFGIYVEKAPDLNRPERKLDIYNVPGRNGSIIRMQDAWENVDQNYEIVAGSSTRGSAPSYWRNVADWLFSAKGYAELSDDFEHGYYRRAFFMGPVDVENLMAEYGRATITFNCDPRRFMVAPAQTFTAAGTITNPTRYTAKPKVVVNGTNYGSGTISVGGHTMQIDTIRNGMVIDAEAQNATNSAGTSNYNNDVTGDWPQLVSGSNTISFTGDITSLEITPYFWTV